MCKMFKRSKPPRFNPIAAPPPPQEIMDVIDEITGTQSIIVTGPDGKKRRVVQKLPRTPQEESFYRQGEELMARSIKNIQELQAYDPYSIVDFAPVIQTFANLNEEQAQDLAKVADFGNIQQDIDNFRQMQTTLMEDQFKRQNNKLDTDLARKGRSQGSFGQEQRARNDYYQNLLRQQNEVNATQYGEDLASQRLNRNLTAYGARQQGRENQLNAAQTEYNLRQQQLQDLENKRQFALNENMQQFGMGAGLTGQDLAKAMASRAPELANQTFAMQSADQLNRYNSDINRQNINYQNRMQRYKESPPSFGEFMGNVIGNQIGASFTAPRSAPSGGGNIGGPAGGSGMSLSKMTKFI